MKKITVILLLSLNHLCGNTQTLAEWTQQKKTQIKYLQQQIIGLQLYIGYLQKGYKIARNGLTAINQVKDGDFNLHNDYFNSLKSINPNVKKYFRITDIISLQSTIIKTSERTIRTTKENRWLTPKEIAYIKYVFIKLLSEASADINQLIALITPNKFIMKDDERITQVVKIYYEMLDKQTFAENFSDRVNILAMQRWKEGEDIEVSRLLNQTNK
jgi:hypothetical protein